MYKWYDKLKDPTRFLVFFIPVSLLVVGMYVPYFPIKFISVGLFLILLVTRMIYIQKYIHKGKRKTNG